MPKVNHENVRRLIDEALPDARVTGFEDHIPTLNLPDPDDRHVLAAAIHCQASVIVTFNLRDFPASSLKPFGSTAQHPAEFAIDWLDESSEAVTGAIRKQRVGLVNPPKTVRQLLLDLKDHDLGALAEALEPYVDRL